MRKCILTICLAIASFGVFAQIPSFGIKGGVNFATITNSADGSSSTSKSLTTFNAGIFADFKFGNLSLQPALYYTGKGGSFEEYSLHPESSNATYTGGSNSSILKENLYYLQLPVNLVFHIPVIAGDIYFGAGPYIAQGLSASTNYNGSEQKIAFGNAPGDIKSQQLGADAIVGFKLKGGLLINANYDLGLSNDNISAYMGSSHSHVFGISLGYVFW